MKTAAAELKTEALRTQVRKHLTRPEVQRLSEAVAEGDDVHTGSAILLPEFIHDDILWPFFVHIGEVNSGQASENPGITRLHQAFRSLARATFNALSGSREIVRIDSRNYCVMRRPTAPKPSLYAFEGSLYDVTMRDIVSFSSNSPFPFIASDIAENLELHRNDQPGTLLKIELIAGIGAKAHQFARDMLGLDSEDNTA